MGVLGIVFAGAPVSQLMLLTLFAEGLGLVAIPWVGCSSMPQASLQVVAKDQVFGCKLGMYCVGT